MLQRLVFVVLITSSVISCVEKAEKREIAELGLSLFSRESLNDLKKTLQGLNGSSVDTISAGCTTKIVQLFTTKNYAVLVGYADAVGKPGSGLFLGNLFWPGSFSECHHIADSKYCLAGFSSHISYQNATILKSPGMLGVCVPKECDAADVQQILTQVSKNTTVGNYISFPTVGVLSTYGANVFCEDNKETYSSGSIAALCVSGVLVFLCLIGTMCELLETFLMFPPKDSNIAGVGIPVLTGTQDEEEFTPDHGLDDNDKLPLVEESHQGYYPPYAGNLIMDCFMCFSVIKNTRALLSTTVPQGAILSVNGIRTVSMLWVIIGHTYSIGLTSGTLANPVDAAKILNRFTFLPVTNGFFSVDSFFLLSGLLVSYLSMRRFDKYGKLPIFKFYLHRFLRLTPTYMFAILFYSYILPHLGKGPLWSTFYAKIITQPCLDNWWTNLLYINNFYPTKLGKECLGWGWYLANDMQFFIISPLILYVMHWFKLAGTLLLNGILMLASMITTAIIIYHYKLHSLEVVADVATRTQVKYSFPDLVYVKPYCRIVPYLVGIILGYILHNKMKLRGRRRPIVAAAGWCIAIIFGTSVTYGTWGTVKIGGHVFTTAENIIYGSFSRLTWGLAVAWVIYACHSNLGGIVNRILGWSAFIPLSRLTYGAYLVHPMVIMLYYTTHYSTFVYTDLIVAFQYVAIAVLSYAAAFFLAIGLEYPILNLDKRIFDHK